MKYAKLGTIIEGTYMRPEDLIPAFRDALGSLVVDGQHKKLIAEIDSELDIENVAEKPDFEYSLSCILEDLADALNEYAPPHCYFGSHGGELLLGTGTDYGFRMYEQTTGDFESCNVHTISEGKNGEQEFLDLDCNLYIEINDHGNVTVSTIDRGEEIFTIV